VWTAFCVSVPAAKVIVHGLPCTSHFKHVTDACHLLLLLACPPCSWSAVRHENLLHRRLSDGRLKINMRLLYTVLLDVAHSLRYLHSMGMVHLDIKAENVLLQSATGRPHGFVCKLGDFGLVKLLGERAFLKNCDTSGTLTHLAPERFQAGSMLTAAADSYGFGVLM
jgi:serine/threonine protein kinase